jgi:Fe-S-cluster containining protein
MGDEPEVNVEQIAYRGRVDAFLTSRDAGCALTADAIQDGLTVDALLSVAADAAIFADEALEIVAQAYRPALACREGCAYCCRKPGVLVALPEVLRILGHARETFTDSQLAELRTRAAGYVAQLQGRHFNDVVPESVPCPLLVDERCSVYEVRPLVCRGFNSTSADACRRAHGNPGALIPLFAILKDVTDGTTVGVAQELRRTGLNGSIVDLGTALHIALESDDDLATSVVQGSRALDAAEDPTWADDLWANVKSLIPAP